MTTCEILIDQNLQMYFYRKILSNKGPLKLQVLNHAPLISYFFLNALLDQNYFVLTTEVFISLIDTKNYSSIKSNMSHTRDKHGQLNTTDFHPNHANQLRLHV